MTLGQRLQNARKEAGLSQEELAEQLGVSRQAVSKWENDSGYPEMEKMIRLSQIYQVSLDYLVGNEQEQEQSNEDIPTKGWYVSHELAEGFLAYQKGKFRKIGICVLLVFLSSALSYIEVCYYDYGGIEDILSTFLIMVTILLIISIAISNNPYKKIWKNTLVFDEEVLKQLHVDFSENKRKTQIMLILEKLYRIEIQDADAYEKVLTYTTYEDSDIVKVVVDDNTIHGVTYGISEDILTFYYKGTDTFFSTLNNTISNESDS